MTSFLLCKLVKRNINAYKRYNNYNNKPCILYFVFLQTLFQNIRLYQMIVVIKINVLVIVWFKFVHFLAVYYYFIDYFSHLQWIPVMTNYHFHSFFYVHFVYSSSIVWVLDKHQSSTFRWLLCNPAGGKFYFLLKTCTCSMIIAYFMAYVSVELSRLIILDVCLVLKLIM